MKNQRVARPSLPGGVVLPPGAEVVPSIELGPEWDAYIQQAIDQADADITDVVRVNFRWKRHQLDAVRRAADLAGVPYQTYIKQVLFQKSTEDIREAQAAQTA